jgi:hypothetical protein
MVGVYVTEHVEVVELEACGAKVHAPPPLKAPALLAGPLRVKLTLPCGAELPSPAVSTTVARQVVG